MSAPPDFAVAEAQRRQELIAALDRLAPLRERIRARSSGYYLEEVARLARFYIPEGARVLEIGSAGGDLLAALKPSRGVGVDISPAAVAIARSKHPQLEFIVGDGEDLPITETFDYVVLSDTLGFFQDVWAAFRSLRRVMGPQSRLLITTFNFLWKPLLDVLEALRLKTPEPEQSWLGEQDLGNLLALNGFEAITGGSAVLLPARVPGLSALCNRLLARLPGLRHLALVKYLLSRPVWHREAPPRSPSCSVIVPCRNERGNVADIFARTPQLGAGTELIFVDGNSTDGTVEEIEKRLPAHPRSRLIHQGAGTGKGDAVRKGFDAARGEVLFILDADLTVPPEDLPKFYAAIAEDRGEFVNGSRLVYPMEDEAMRLLNLMGNKFFSLAFTWILGRPVKDTLCGTKVLSRRSWERIVAGRSHFGDFDPFGDFDLLFGAAKAGLKIVELPVRYRARKYGETKIDRFRHGWLLLRMTWLAFRKFKLNV
jgi:SAM-dependent methyltransferase